MSDVVVVPYSADWPSQYQAEREALLAVLAPIEVVVEHIGSTSVPGLAAKPVLDVLLGAPSLRDIESKIGPLGRLGYSYVPKYEVEIPARRYFVRAPTASPRVHLHGVELGSRIWREHVAFRDLLRSDAGLRSRYQALKLQLAARFVHDKAAYSTAKGPFIRSVLAAVASQ